MLDILRRTVGAGPHFFRLISDNLRSITNDIYRLNKQTGVLKIQNYSMENEQFVIRCVLSYDNMLMISKYSLSETDTKDKLYLVPFTDNSLSN